MSSAGGISDQANAGFRESASSVAPFFVIRHGPSPLADSFDRSESAPYQHLDALVDPGDGCKERCSINGHAGEIQLCS